MVTYAGSDVAEVFGDGAPSLAEQREALVREHLESGRADDLASPPSTLVAERYELVPTGQVYQGLEAVATLYQTTRLAFPDMRNEVAAVHHAGDTLIVEFDMSGTQLGAFQEIEPTGCTIRCRMVALFTFEGLDVVSERIYFDAATIRRQLGVEDPPPRTAV